MFHFKNVFIIVIIIAILLGGATGLYLTKIKKVPPVRDNLMSTGSGASAEKVGEVLKKINNLTNE